MALIYISLMISDNEDLFMCLLAFRISSLEKSLFWSSAHFKLDFFFSVIQLCSSLNILHIKPLSDIWFANIFSHSEGWLFILLITSFAVKKAIFLLHYSPIIEYNMYLKKVYCGLPKATLTFNKTELPELLTWTIHLSTLKRIILYVVPNLIFKFPLIFFILKERT